VGFSVAPVVDGAARRDNIDKDLIFRAATARER
jgi:hypothetical protein